MLERSKNKKILLGMGLFLNTVSRGFNLNGGSAGIQIKYQNLLSTREFRELSVDIESTKTNWFGTTTNAPVNANRLVVERVEE